MTSFLDYTIESFARVFKLDVNPELSEDENVRIIIHQSAFVCSALTWLQPIPLADFILLAPLHAKMTIHIGAAKGFDINDEDALELFKEIAGSVGLSFLSQQVILGAGKFVPVLFGLYLFPMFYAATWAMGRVVEHYFEIRKTGRTPSHDDLRDVYRKALVSGKLLGAKLSLEEIKKKAAELKASLVGEKTDEGDKSAAPQIIIKGKEPAAPREPPSRSPIKISERHPREELPEEDAQEDLIDALEELAARRSRGELSAENFQVERQRILEKL